MYVQYKKKDIYPGPGGQGGSYVSTLLELDPTQLSRYQQVKKKISHYKYTVQIKIKIP